MTMTQQCKPIPIEAAKRIAQQYGYQQVMIYARHCDAGGEHMTTYGVNREHCNAMGVIGKYLREKIMRWTKE